jgi:hypothetical protein
MDLIPTQFETEDSKYTLKLVSSIRDGRWGLYRDFMRFNKITKTFSYEMLPSSRDDEWIEAHSMPLDEAMFWIQELEKEDEN